MYQKTDNSSSASLLLSPGPREDPDLLLAMAGKVSSELQADIRVRPMLFARLIRELKDMPDHAVLRVVRENREGDW